MNTTFNLRLNEIRLMSDEDNGLLPFRHSSPLKVINFFGDSADTPHDYFRFDK